MGKTKAEKRRKKNRLGDRVDGMSSWGAAVLRPYMNALRRKPQRKG